MKISELLEKLGELQGIHGDVEVYCFLADPDDDAWDETRDPEPLYQTFATHKKYCKPGVWL